MSSDVSTAVSTINLLPDGTNVNGRSQHRRFSDNSSSDDDVDHSMENTINKATYKMKVNNENLPKTTSKQPLTSSERKVSPSSSSTSPNTVVVDIEDLINTGKSKDETKK